MIPFLSVKPSAIKLKVRPIFPAGLVGGTGIAVTKAGGIYTIDLNYQELQAAAVGGAANDWLVIWDDVSGQFFRIKISDFIGLIGGVPEAPNDGTTYGRKNLGWVPIIGAVSSVFGRTGAVVAQAGDYNVAQVTGAAPLASPVFTGDPQAPTPAAGDNDTSIATTAFVAVSTREKLTQNRYYAVSSSQGSDLNNGQANSHVNAVTFTNGSANIGWAANTPAVNEVVSFESNSALPTNFNTLQGYYVKTSSAGVVTVSRTVGGTAIVAGSAGSGTHIGKGYNAFATLQKAMDTIAALDTSIFNVQVSVACGNYAALVLKNCVGAAQVQWFGDRTVYPTACGVVITSAGYPILADGLLTRHTMFGFGVATTANQNDVLVSGGSNLSLYDFEWNGVIVGNYHLWCANSTVALYGRHKISGNAASFALSDTLARVYLNSTILDITANLTMSGAFATARRNSYFESTQTFNLNGFTVTGTRFAATNCSGFAGTGGVAGHFPGTVNGTPDATSYYT